MIAHGGFLLELAILRIKFSFAVHSVYRPIEIKFFIKTFHLVHGDDRMGPKRTAQLKKFSAAHETIAEIV